MVNLFIEFTRPKNKLSLISLLVRLVERTKYSHVRIRFITKLQDEIVFEADGGKVRYINKVITEEDKSIIVERYLVKLTDNEYRNFISYCLRLVGIKYGYLQLFGQFLVRVFNLRKNPLADGMGSMVCSELIYYILNKVLLIPLRFRPEIDGPKRLNSLLANLNNKRLIKLK